MRGGAFDRWDLEIRGGVFGAVRTRMAVEEHGGGRQLIRFRAWPKLAPLAPVLILLSAGLAVGAALGQAWLASVALGAVATFLGIRAFGDCAGAMATYLHALERLARGER